MKQILLVLFAAIAVAVTEGSEYPSVFGDMRVPCINKTVDQIGCEVRASLEYLKFGAYWSMDTVNRPGLAKFFFESASEEREHAIKLIEYFNMRGAHQPGAAKLIREIEPLLKHAKECPIFNDIKDICTVNFENFDKSFTGAKAFDCALKMEMAVTAHIKEVIQTCEAVDANCDKNDLHCSNNDYHYVDYLTGEFLTEQYEGQRKIAGYMKTLEKMELTHGNIGEFFFDKTLLE